MHMLYSSSIVNAGTMPSLLLHDDRGQLDLVLTTWSLSVLHNLAAAAAKWQQPCQQQSDQTAAIEQLSSVWRVTYPSMDCRVLADLVVAASHRLRSVHLPLPHIGDWLLGKWLLWAKEGCPWHVMKCATGRHATERPGLHTKTVRTDSTAQCRPCKDWLADHKLCL